MTPPTSVSSKSSAGLGGFYDLNAFHSNGNLQTQLKLSQNCFAHVNRNKRLTACIMQLLHFSGSLINSYQEVAELIKTTFLGFFREDEGSTPVLHPRAQTYMADPLRKSGVLWTALTLIKTLALIGFSLRSSKPLTPTFLLYMPECLTLNSKLPRSLKIGTAQK